MLHKEFWGLLFLAFVAWIVLAASPSKRIENGCRPVHWAGNVVTSASALVLPKQQVTVQGWFDKVEYGCQYTVWRLFYQTAYNEWLANKEAAEQAEVLQSTQKVAPAPAADDHESEDAPAAPDASAPSKGGGSE